MAATSSTRRRGRARAANRRDNRSQEVTVSFPRALVNRVANYFREREALAEAIQSRIFASAISETGSAQSVARQLGMTLGFEGPANARRQPTARSQTRSREMIGTPTAPRQRQPRRARGRPRSTTRTARAAAGALDLANLGRGNTLADQVYRNLPAIGQTTTLANLGRGCTLPNGSAPRNQDIGAVANRLQKAGIIRRGTGRNRNEVTTLSREAIAA